MWGDGSPHPPETFQMIITTTTTTLTTTTIA